MPLLDHFRAPLSHARHWESFLGAWAYGVVERLNRRVLPPGYFAEHQMHVGPVEIDVPTFEDDSPSHIEGNGGVAVQTWAPPAVALAIPAVFPDEIEVRVFHQQGGPQLVAAIELVSPGNKDRPETREAFAAKCATYLQARVGLVIVDVVTERSANLHNGLMDLLKAASARLDPEPALYTVSYRPVRSSTGDRIDIWPTTLELGRRRCRSPCAAARRCRWTWKRPMRKRVAGRGPKQCVQCGYAAEAGPPLLQATLLRGRVAFSHSGTAILVFDHGEADELRCSCPGLAQQCAHRLGHQWRLFRSPLPRGKKCLGPPAPSCWRRTACSATWCAAASSWS